MAVDAFPAPMAIACVPKTWLRRLVVANESWKKWEEPRLVEGVVVA